MLLAATATALVISAGTAGALEASNHEITETLNNLHTSNPSIYPNVSSFNYTDNLSIELNTSELTITEDINWVKNTGLMTAQPFTFDEVTGKGSGTIQLSIPDGTIEYYTYNYTIPDGYTKQSDKIVNLTENLDDKYFYGITSSGANSGAIVYNSNKSEYSIKSDFISNTVNDERGAIFNVSGRISDIYGNFINNTGGAGSAVDINRSGSRVNSVTGNFIGNIATNTDDGSAVNVWDKAYVDRINGKFISNRASRNGGAISFGTTMAGSAGSINGTFINNIANNQGGAINAKLKNTVINSITGDFISNSANSAGAIIVGGTVGSITGDFIGNNSKTTAGAIYNTGEIDKLEGSFVYNNAGSTAGAIYNTGKINTIYCDFILNKAKSNAGAIYNTGNIKNLEGNFINNISTGSGSAIFNVGGTIENINNSNFISNYVTSNNGTVAVQGGEINIYDSNFIDNLVKSNHGAAIDTWANGNVTITAKNSDVLFSGNKNQVKFTLNSNGYVTKTSGGDYVDINNQATINLNANSDHTITFDGQFISGTANDLGGVLNINKGVYNKDNDNYDSSTTGGKYIFNNTLNGQNINLYNDAQIILGSKEQNNGITTYGNINSANSSLTNDENGGYISITNNNIDTNNFGNLTLNSDLKISTDLSLLDGNSSQIDNIILASTDSSMGNLVIDKFNLLDGYDFSNYKNRNYKVQVFDNIGNSDTLQLALSENAKNQIGGVRSWGTSIEIENGFKDTLKAETKYTDKYYSYGLEKTIEHFGTIDVIGKDSIGYVEKYKTENSAERIGQIQLGDTLSFVVKGKIEDDELIISQRSFIAADATDSYIVTDNLDAMGGEKLVIDGGINNAGINGNSYDGIIVGDGQTLELRNLNEYRNFSKSAVNNGENGLVKIENVHFADNPTDILNDGTVEFRGGNSISKINGEGEIQIKSGATEFKDSTPYSITEKNISISQGAQLRTNANALHLEEGITNFGELEFSGGNNEHLITGDGVFINSGNTLNNNNINQKTIINNGSLTSNSEQLASDRIENNGILTYNSGGFTTSDIVGDGSVNSKVELKTDSDFIINHTISKTNIDLYNSMLNFSNSANIASSTMNVYGGGMNFSDGKISTVDLGTINLYSNTNLALDFRLDNLTSDNFNAIVHNNGGKFNVNGINIIGTTTSDNIRVHLGDTTKLGQENLTSETIELPSFMTPIRKVNGKLEDGWIIYSGVGSTSSGDFNPSVVANPVMTKTGSQANMNNTFNYVFQNADSFTRLPASDRFLIMNANKYAIADTKTPKIKGTSTDFNLNMNLNYTEENRGVWFRPYALFENIPLKNGPKVNAISYGSLIGYDSEFRHHKHGWHSVTGGYIGYNGAQVDYANVDTSMNGGLLGFTKTFYKKNFWTALTTTVGANVSENSTMYGHDTSTSIDVGVGSKTGYNFEFKDGKFIIQPIWFMSYSMVNVFDYRNAAGVKIDSKPIHTLQLNPTIRFIGNFKGWQPYASVGMVWNAMDKSNTTANGIKLPQMHVKPYVRYGVGIQKQIKDNFTLFAQAMIHNGGRNGIALTGGFRWTLSNNTSKEEKVNTQTPKTVKKDVKNRPFNVINVSKFNKKQIKNTNICARTVIKQLSPTQKSHINNTTKTSMSAVVDLLGY